MYFLLFFLLTKASSLSFKMVKVKEAYFYQISSDKNHFEVKDGKLIVSPTAQSSNFQYLQMTPSEGILVFDNRLCLENENGKYKVSPCKMEDLFGKKSLFVVISQHETK